MVVQPSAPVPHKEQEIRLRAAETTSNSLVMVSKHTRRERLAQASMDSSERQTNVSYVYYVVTHMITLMNVYHHILPWMLKQFVYTILLFVLFVCFMSDISKME